MKLFALNRLLKWKILVRVSELVFQQNAKQRQVFHHEFFQLLQQEAQL